jgi:hypothetical protein
MGRKSTRRTVCSTGFAAFVAAHLLAGCSRSGSPARADDAAAPSPGAAISPRLTETEVQTLLRGPYKDYVGSWCHDIGSIRIDANGLVKYHAAVGPMKESATGMIVSFDNRAFEAGGIRFEISQPPRREQMYWSANMHGINWVRSLEGNGCAPDGR